MEYVEQKQCSSWNVCNCGKPKKAWRNYCPDCSRSQRRGWDAQTPEHKRRANARSYLNVYVRRGKVAKQPCARCGCSEVEAHHDDYSKPLEVTWLCRDCHMVLHGVAIARRLKCTKTGAGWPVELIQFYDELHRRGVTTEHLAEWCGRARTSITKVFTCHAKRGPTWKAVRRYLTIREIDLLDRAHATDWAKRRLEKLPKWTPEKAERLSA